MLWDRVKMKYLFIFKCQLHLKWIKCIPAHVARNRDCGSQLPSTTYDYHENNEVLKVM